MKKTENQKLIDAINRLVVAIEELKQKLDQNNFPYTWPSTPPIIETITHNACNICGIDFGNGALGYYCARHDCPMQATCSNINPKPL